MIKIFRKIRQNLLMENKTRKYIKYAFGEIILVMIGILLALQVNNWNQLRIKQNEINDSLTQILNDLKQDKATLEYFDKREETHVSYLKNVSKGNYNLVGLDSILKSLDHYMYFSKSNNGYASLKESGKISNIKNTELKNSITEYYEYVYEILTAASHFSETFTNNRVIPYAISNLEANFESFTKEELVIEKLETSDLRYLINYQITVKNYSLSQVKNGLKKNHELSLLIESEFNK